MEESLWTLKVYFKYLSIFFSFHCAEIFKMCFVSKYGKLKILFMLTLLKSIHKCIPWWKILVTNFTGIGQFHRDLWAVLQREGVIVRNIIMPYIWFFYKYMGCFPLPQKFRYSLLPLFTWCTSCQNILILCLFLTNLSSLAANSWE